MTMYISNSSEDELDKYLQELLETTNEDLKNISEILKRAFEQDNFVVVGNSQKLKEIENEFKQIVNLKK